VGFDLCDTGCTTAETGNGIEDLGKHTRSSADILVDGKEGNAYEKLLDEVLRLWGEISRELILELDDLLEHEIFRARLEGRMPREHLEDDAAEAPVVGAANGRLYSRWQGKKEREGRRTIGTTPSSRKGSPARRILASRRKISFDAEGLLHARTDKRRKESGLALRKSKQERDGGATHHPHWLLPVLLRLRHLRGKGVSPSRSRSL